MSFAQVAAVADAVLLEGYVLYPYRASSTKNRFRWSFGILSPRSWSEAAGSDPWWMETQVLVAPAGRVVIDGRLRFLQVRRRTIEVRQTDGTFREVGELRHGEELLIPWEEGEIREIDFTCDLGRCAVARDWEGGEGSRVVPFDVSGGESVEEVRGAEGETIGRVRRIRLPAQGTIRIGWEPVRAGEPLVRLALRVENTTEGVEDAASRETAMWSSCVSTHLLLKVCEGSFVSLLDPPAWAGEAASACRNVRVYPVLAGEEGSADMILASPIILYDHPKIAPESPGDLCDATEIDEILSLRTLLLTDEEKRQARATDERAAAIVGRTDGMPPEMWARLHGALRDFDRPEMTPRGGNPNELLLGDRAAGSAAREPGSPASAPGTSGTHAGGGASEALATWQHPGGAAELESGGPSSGLAPAGAASGAVETPPWPELVTPGLEVIPARNEAIGPFSFAAGNRVRLKAGVRRADAQDRLYEGRIARVEKIVRDVDGRELLGVTIEDDPAAEFHRWYGRFLYYGVDEVEPIEPPRGGS